MKLYFKYLLQLIVFIHISVANAGSYDDFFTAIETNHPSTVSGLLKRGFDPNTRNPKGEHPLILAVRGAALQVVDVLLANPATQIDTRSAQDETPLMLAALKGYAEVCQKLIARDADVNKTGWAPLHYAATGGHIVVMRMLLDGHAYIDAASPNGSTPLMMAARYGSIDAVKLLLEGGADPLLKNDLGLTAIDFANSVQRTESANIIGAFIRAQRPKGSW